MYKVHEVNKIKTIYDLIWEITSNDDFFKKETIIITSNDLVQESIKKYIAKKNEVSYNLNFKKNIMKVIYDIAVENKNIRSYLEQNTLLLYSETEKFILYNLLKNKEIKSIKEFKSVKSRYMYASKIISLFHKYYSKFFKVISTWQEGKTLLEHSDNKIEELSQKEIFSKLFEAQISIFDLYEKILNEEENGNKIDIAIKKIILIGDVREIDRKIFYAFSKIFALQIYELRFKNTEKYNTPFVNELIIKTNLNNDTKLLCDDLVDHTELLNDGSFLSSLKNKIIKNTSLAPTEGSFKIIEASSKKREVEILVNNIIYSTQTKHINLSEIAITGVQNEFEEYLPYLRDLLTKYEIDFININLESAAHKESIMALKSLLNLFISSKGKLSNFSKKEIFEFMLNKRVLKKFKIAETDANNLVEFTQLSNIVFALNNEHREKLEYENKFLNSWEDGFSRFLLSLVFDVSYDHYGSDLNPLEKVEFQDKEQIIKLIIIVRSLYYDISFFIQKEYTVYEWAEIIEIFVEKYIELEKDDPVDEFLRTRIKYLRNFSKDFNENLYKDYMESIKEKKVEFALFKLMLEESLEKKILKNSNSKNGLHILPLKDLKYLKAQEIHFLGTNKINIDLKSDDMDLLNEYYENLNVENENVQDFIETMFLAEKKFYAYYSNNPNDEVARENKIIKKIVSLIKKENSDFEVEKHPNEYYNASYFKDSRPSFLQNYDKDMFKLAKSYLNSDDYTKPVNHERVKLEHKLDVSLRSIQKALENPYKYFYEKTLGIYIKDTEREKTILEKNEEYFFKFRQSILKELIFSYIKNELTENEISEILGIKILDGIKSGTINLQINKDKFTKSALETFGRIKHEVINNFSEFLQAEKISLNLDKQFKFELENENFEITLKGELEDIYKVGNDYFFVDFIEKDYSSSRDYSTMIELYIKGILLKSEIKDLETITFRKIANDRTIKPSSMHKHKTKYKNKELDTADIENILAQYIYILSYPIPAYRTIITTTLTKLSKESELSFTTALNETIKNPPDVYSLDSKEHEDYLMRVELGKCEYYKRFKDTNNWEISKNLLNLLESFYLKFLN